MYAARWGGPNALPDMKQLLYDDVVEINEQDKQTKETAIQIAASAGQVEILRWLLEKGADINSNSGGGSTPLIHGIRRRNTPIILALLKDKNIDTLVTHKISGRVALHYSVAGRPDMKIARLLIQRDRRICAIKDKKGRTPIELYKSKPQKGSRFFRIHRGQESITNVPTSFPGRVLFVPTPEQKRMTFGGVDRDNYKTN